MSTKIYTGFRMGCSWQQAHECIMGFRKELQELYHKEFFAKFVNSMCFYIDCKVLGLDPGGPEDNPYYFAFQALRKQHEKEPDFFDLVLFPFRDEIYGMSFTSQNDNTWTDLWFSKDPVEEYRYWNNTDRPVGVTEEHWDQRSKTWDLIIGEFYSIPAMNGFTAQCLEKLPPFVQGKELVPYIPTLEARARLVSMDILLEQWHKNTQDTNGFHFLSWVRENQDQLIQEITRVTPLLAPDLTSEISNPL